MKIAILQSNIHWENKDDNLKYLVEKIQSAEDMSDCSILLLPEMSYTGFSMNTRQIGEDNYESIEKTRRICLEYNMTIGFGWVEGKENSRNHYTIIDRDGTELSDYIKIHPFSYAEENKHFSKGNNLTFFTLSGCHFSTVICYDLRFPELFSIASRRADIIIVPANWPMERSEHWRCLLKARAIENQVYIIGINCVGRVGDKYYGGDSCVIDPYGEYILSCDDTEGIRQVEFDVDIEGYRDSFPTYSDKRTDLYRALDKEYR